ncbi:hypothetical protein CHGG_02868 [Chaetomium globosum CBS 148.51]|uniref:Serine-rich protein n=1 Tax=Chaetomium globosum (strain ATCC 6205 / CBS 148.51 / DSM 1962 / NBRC 6347 / NRRL 1970) TaxID=306901 RepID=Q2HA86_CHAGB|nr:uncharacterized protein CHGG_02868 [Chaetomium globosum CBS 148.51]EAQ90933.1 hypothetical protein CHGG_02868 [Chaetomium globosum CBS 148.51]
MSAPSARHGRTQSLQERSNSQTNKPGIRLVPYSPPRLDPEDRAPSQASSRENRSSGHFNDQASSNASHSRRTSWRDEVTDGQGSALSSPTARRSSLARSRDERVSGVKPLGSPSTLGPAGPTAPTLRSPSEVSANTTDFNAPAPRRSRAESSPSPATAHSRHKRSDSRRGTLRLAVHSNGTFSLVPEEPQSDVSDSAAASVTGSVTGSVTESLTSHLPSYTSRTPSAQDRASTDTWSERRSSTPLTGASTVVLDQSFSDKRHSTPSRASSSTQLAEDSSGSSPWNYRLVGGLRKVPSTPDNKGKQAAYASSTSSAETQLPPLPEASSSASEKEEGTSTRTVVRKTSFSSGVSNQTIQTVSEATNYKVYGPASTAQESRDSLPFNFAGPSNWEVIGQSSPAPAFPSRPTTASHGGDENYVLHGAPSVSPSSSLVAVSRKPRPAYSQESLVVAPLRPAKKPSYERFGYYKQRSRETLRSRTGSVQSLKSLSSIITGRRSAQRCDSPCLTPASSTNASMAPMLQSQPHQWSSQLSTVMSESEGGSDPARSVSPLSEGSGGHQRRRSSTGWVSSLHSRQLASISSSMAGQLDEAATTSASDSLERPPQSYARAGPSQIRMIRDQDEHGDGAALTCAARVYYGSGERRFLGRRPSFLTISDSGDSRPPSSGVLGSESPNTDNFPQAIFSPRKRAREVQPNNGQQRSPDQASMEISPAPQGHDYNVFRTLRQKTSSIWSPHLQPDRRATRYSVWDPPSVSWSADSSILGRRNAQVLLFIIGFIFPLAWMIAAFLPLPPNPKALDVENGENKYTSTHPAFRYQKYAVDETRYESARWWRNLNRGMSIIGLLIIGAVVALAVIGVRQGWGH